MFEIKVSFWEKGYPKNSEKHFMVFTGERMSEAVYRWKNAEYHHDLAKYEPMKVVDVIDTEEKNPILWYEASKFDMVVAKLSAMGFKFEILNHNSGNFAIRVYYDESDDYTVITPSDDNREDYVCVAGIVQNFNEWLMREK